MAIIVANGQGITAIPFKNKKRYNLSDIVSGRIVSIYLKLMGDLC